MVAHGFSVALLFLLATSIHQRTHTLDMTWRWAASRRRRRYSAAFFVAGTFASIGLPPFAPTFGAN